MNNNNEDNLKFRIARKNIWLMGIGVLIIVVGLALMLIGKNSGPDTFEPDIFSFRRIVVAPMVVFFGYLSIIVAICYRPKQNKE